MTQETWYVLEDGTAVDPNEVTMLENGRYRHRGGGYVAMRGDVPSSRGVDPTKEREKAAAAARAAAPKVEPPKAAEPPKAPEPEAKKSEVPRPEPEASSHHQRRDMRPAAPKRDYNTR